MAQGALFLVASLFVPTGALAQPPDEPPGWELYEEARVAFAAGEYLRAAELLERLYALVPRPVLLYNRARALERAGEPCEAALLYRRYLEAAEDPTDPRSIEARLVELDAECAPSDAASESDAPVTADPPPPAPASRDGDLVGGGLLLGVGLAGVAAATVLGALALERRAVAERPETAMADAADAASLADDLAIGANIGWAVGGAVVITGLVWLIVAVSQGPPDASQARVTF